KEVVWPHQDALIRQANCSPLRERSTQIVGLLVFKAVYEGADDPLAAVPRDRTVEVKLAAVAIRTAKFVGDVSVKGLRALPAEGRLDPVRAICALRTDEDLRGRRYTACCAMRWVKERDEGLSDPLDWSEDRHIEARAAQSPTLAA